MVVHEVSQNAHAQLGVPITIHRPPQDRCGLNQCYVEVARILPVHTSTFLFPPQVCKAGRYFEKGDVIAVVAIGSSIASAVNETISNAPLTESNVTTQVAWCQCGSCVLCPTRKTG